MRRHTWSILCCIALLAGCGKKSGGEGGENNTDPAISDGRNQPAIELVGGEDSLGEGLGQPPQFVPPVQVEGRIVQAVAGDAHVCALDEAGRAWCWGDPTSVTPEPWQWPTRPTRIQSAELEHLIAGPTATCGVTAEGKLQCWGLAFQNRAEARSTVAWTLDDNTSFENVWLTGFGSELALDQGGGNVLVIKDNQTRTNFTFSGAPDVVVGNSDQALCALISGDVWCVGPNTTGLGGTGDTGQLVQPTRVADVSNAVGLSFVGRSSICAQQQSGEVVCWPGLTSFAPEVAGQGSAGEFAGGCALSGGTLRCGAPGALGRGCEVGNGTSNLSAGFRRACVQLADESWACAGRPPGEAFDVPGLTELPLSNCAP